MLEKAGMVKAYSYDLRQKVMQAIELDGIKKSEASQVFNISRNTINLWFHRRAETGDVAVKPRVTSSPKQKITDWEKFRAFAKGYL
ncbi:helix-turn-helix domain-containing protein [Leptolyngbya sp. FACHB-36]|nr:helix-turn-helix domain-containing protein [Leptolyngbya sp. FACHB-36]